MKCLVCSNPGLPKHQGCCSRGCMRFHLRRHPPQPRPAPMPEPAIAVAPAMPPAERARPPDPDQSPVYTCCDCQKQTPDWGAFDAGFGRYRCAGCHAAWKARKLIRDDRAIPTAPDEGGGVRVIRSTRGLGG